MPLTCTINIWEEKKNSQLKNNASLLHLFIWKPEVNFSTCWHMFSDFYLFLVFFLFWFSRVNLISLIYFACVHVLRNSSVRFIQLELREWLVFCTNASCDISISGLRNCFDSCLRDRKIPRMRTSNVMHASVTDAWTAAKTTLPSKSKLHQIGNFRLGFN